MKHRPQKRTLPEKTVKSEHAGFTAKDEQENKVADFQIIGIGSSAGGIESFEQFLSVLPQKFGFAIVFIQHLSAKQKSLLPGLLRSKKPDIEINEISDGMEILPGRIYLSPPGKEIRIQKGSFRVTARRKVHLCLPVDDFFESLAEEAGERAIAVILSGAGTDGARGVQSIRMMGGTIFVQDPGTAEFPGMPRAAINTDLIDGVFPPADIAREILKMQDAGVTSASAGSLISASDFQTFYRLIRDKTGCSFDHYKKTVVGRRIRRRMYLHGVSSIREYFEIIEKKDSEASMLASDLMIGVTSFFRDRLAWKALKIEVLRKFVTENDNSQLRVWTPASATGEEAYSIALLLRNELDISGKKREIQIFATDVNDIALEKAREGAYPASIIADVPPDYRHKYFTYSEDGLTATIDKGIREQVVFARQDILTDPPFSKLDLIICRNLLIYLEPEAQEKCLAIFHYALKDGRYLFLGNAESPGRNSALFKSIGHKKCRIYTKVEKSPSLRMPLAVPYAAERSASLPPKQTQISSDQPSVIQFVQGSLLEEYAPSAVAINQNYDIFYHNGPTNRYLRQPQGAPTQNLLKLLPENLHSRIRAAVYKAAHEMKSVSVRTSISGDGKKRQITLRISKLKENLYLVVFREKSVSSEPAGAVCLEAAEIEETSARQLETELSATREALQNNIEQLKSLNEELQSSNEELQAANEELETSREELQSLNEELITVNSQLQSKIEEQEETNDDLNNFLASTSIPTFFLDHEFRVKRFTPAMARLLKFIPSDVGRPIIDMSQENLGPDLIADAGAVLEHLSPIKREISINGSYYIRATLPYRTSDNRIEGVVITYIDITEVKRAEEALKKAYNELEMRVQERTKELRETNELLQIENAERTKAEEAAKTERQRLFDVLETLPAMICLLTPDHHVAFANRSFRERFGESGGRHCYEYCFNRTEPCEFCETYKVLETGKPHHWEVTGPDGSVIDAYDFPFTDMDGSPLILEMDLDITERRRAEEELKKHKEHLEELVRERTAELETANKDLENFSYAVSHDLKTPLRSMQGFAQAIIDDYYDKLDDGGKDFLRRITSAGERMTQLIDAMLELSRLTGRDMISKSVNLSSIAEVIAYELKKKEPDRQVEFVIAKGVKAQGDLDMLEIVLRNLFDNAWKFTSKHASARIEFGAFECGIPQFGMRNAECGLKTQTNEEFGMRNETNSAIRIPQSEIEEKTVYFVRDNGAGFNMEFADKLFMPFRRLHQESEFPGLGIGLATVHKIISKHGGKIWAESEPEKGATFNFTLK